MCGPKGLNREIPRDDYLHPQGFPALFIKGTLQSQNRLLYPVNQYTSHVADESNPSNALHVPAESDFLQSHDYYACCRTNDEHRAAHTSPTSANGYIPIQPATRGTLSIILDNTPIMPVIR